MRRLECLLCCLHCAIRLPLAPRRNQHTFCLSVLLQAPLPTTLTPTAKIGDFPPTTGRRWPRTATCGGGVAWRTWRSESAHGRAVAGRQAISPRLQQRCQSIPLRFLQVLPLLPHRPHPWLLSHLGDPRRLQLRHPWPLPALHSLVPPRESPAHAKPPVVMEGFAILPDWSPMHCSSLLAATPRSSLHAGAGVPGHLGL